MMNSKKDKLASVDGKVTFEKAVASIRQLVKAKGHEDSLDKLETKFLFAIVEISEATDLWKKQGALAARYEIAEEIIDAIFYLLDAYGLLMRDARIDASPSEMFLYKLAKNWNRPKRYGRPESQKTKAHLRRATLALHLANIMRECDSHVCELRKADDKKNEQNKPHEEMLDAQTMFQQQCPIKQDETKLPKIKHKVRQNTTILCPYVADAQKNPFTSGLSDDAYWKLMGINETLHICSAIRCPKRHGMFCMNPDRWQQIMNRKKEPKK